MTSLSLSCYLTETFLGTFVELRIRHVCPSVRMEPLGFHCKVFRETLYFGIFRKFVEKIQVSLKSDRNNGYFA